MRYSWLFILPLIAIISIIAYSIRRLYTKRRPNKKAIIVAHSKRIRNLPEYEKARVRYRILLTLMAIAFVTALSSVTISASRPISVEVNEPDYETRDIMLCIDMSASTDNVREDIIDYLSEVATGLKGQRLGVTIFATKSASLSPLTNDYESLQGTLDTMRDSFKTDSSGMRESYYQYIVGATSDIGTGIVNCINNFDQLKNEGHSQSVIITTDNVQNTGDIMIEQAANYAKRFGITFYGVNTEPRNVGAAEPLHAKQFRNAVALTGGVYYSTGASGLSATEIVDEILKQEAIKHDSEKQYVQTDSPVVFESIAAVSVVLFIFLVWRIGL